MGSSLNKLPPILHKPCFSDGITPRLPAKPVYRHTPSNPAACQSRRDHPLHPSSRLAVEEHRDRAAPATPACLATSAAQRQEPSHWAGPKTFAIQASPSLLTWARLGNPREPSWPEAWQTPSHDPSWQPPAPGCVPHRPPKTSMFCSGCVQDVAQ